MTRAALIPFAWLLGGLLVVLLCVATVVWARLLRALKHDFPAVHGELGRPSLFYFVALGWLMPSRFGIWLLSRPDSLQTLPDRMQRDAALLRRLVLVAFVLWGTGVALVIASAML